MPCPADGIFGEHGQVRSLPQRIVLSVDLGTNGCRAAAYDAKGARLGTHHVEYGLTHPEPGAAEQEAEGWWSAARACVRAVVDQLDDPSSVVAIGVSAQGHSWVPTSADFRALRPALTWLDTRAAGVAAQLLKAKGAHFWGHTAGKVPGAWHTLAQILWLREREPAVQKAAAWYLYAHDFLIGRLTGNAVTDYTTAAASLLYDVTNFQWDRQIALEWRVDVDRFATPVQSGSVAGGLRWQVAGELGLPAGIPVAVGAQDQKCAALGAGLEPGVATASLGTATAITALAARPTFDEATAIPCFPYLVKNSWVLEAPLTTTGAAVRWLRDLLVGFGADDVSYAAVDRIAEDAVPGCDGVRFFPYLAGAGAPHWLGDVAGAFVGLKLDTRPADIARSVLESVGFEIRTNLDAMRGQNVAIERFRVFGGGAKSDLWCQMIADICRVPVERCVDVETAAMGAAMLALVAAGVFPTAAQAQDAIGHGREWFEPSAEPAYEDSYRQYCNMRTVYWRMNSPGRRA